MYIYIYIGFLDAFNSLIAVKTHLGGRPDDPSVDLFCWGFVSIHFRRYSNHENTFPRGLTEQVLCEIPI